MNKLLAFAFLLTSVSAFAADWVVTSTDDAANPADGTFRNAINKAADGDRILFDSSIAGGTINLYATPASARCDTSFTINNKALTIIAPEGGITFNGGWNYLWDARSDDGTRIFLVTNTVGKTVFKGVTFKGGHARGWSSTKEYYQGGAVGAYSDVRFEECNFIQNGASDYTDNAPVIRGGGAIYSEDCAIEMSKCSFISNIVISGSVSYGGAILAKGGTIEASDSYFYRNKSRSYCGGLYLYGCSNASFENCLFIESENPGGNGVHGGCFWANMPADANLFFKGCAFRNCRSHGSGTFGGAVYSQGASPNYYIDCEFDGCSSETGGAVRNTGRGYYVNCTFNRCASKEWGPQVDIRGQSYLVNCTFIGGFSYSSNSSNGGNALCCGANGTFLNTVSVYSYFGASSLTMKKDINNNGGSKTFINTVTNGKDNNGNDIDYAETLADVPTSASLFADYEMMSTMMYLNDDEYALAHSVVCPKIEALDETTAMRPRVVPIAQGGLLDGTGYPVKVNPDYTYCAYSTDNGSTWTTLWGTDDGKAEPITKDQLGNPYYNGLTPIGAATYVAEVKNGLVIIVR